MVPEKNTFRLEGAGIHSFGSKVRRKKGLRLVNGDEDLDRRKRFSTCTRRSSKVPLVVDLAVLHPTSKGEGMSCPSNDIQDTTANSYNKCVGQ